MAQILRFAAAGEVRDRLAELIEAFGGDVAKASADALAQGYRASQIDAALDEAQAIVLDRSPHEIIYRAQQAALHALYALGGEGAGA